MGGLQMGGLIKDILVAENLTLNSEGPDFVLL
jgi:hypothetical protein